MPINCAGSAEECASTVVNVLEMTGADEVIIAELSSDRDDHLRALSAIFAMVQDAVPAARTGREAHVR